MIITKFISTWVLRPQEKFHRKSKEPNLSFDLYFSHRIYLPCQNKSLENCLDSITSKVYDKKNVINLQSKLMFVFSDVVIIVSRNGLAIVSISFDLTVPLNLTMYEIVFKRER